MGEDGRRTPDTRTERRGTPTVRPWTATEVERPGRDPWAARTPDQPVGVLRFTMDVGLRGGGDSGGPRVDGWTQTDPRTDSSEDNALT